MHLPNLQPYRLNSHPQHLSPLLLYSVFLCLTLSACSDDSNTGEAQGADVGDSCIDASDCVRGLLCIGRVCTDPNNPNTSGGATTDNNGTNGGVITGGGTTTAASNSTTDANTTSNGTTVNNSTNTGGTTSTGEGTTPPDGDCIAGQDQDGDGIDDAVEGSGDRDQDGLVNCLDTDSDNDGLTDAEETALGTDPTFNDSDRDRASDLLEWAAGTALDDPQDQPENAILIVVDADEQEVSRQFEFSSQVQRSDVYILMDTSTTMDGEIENLKRTLVTSILPDIRARVPDTWFGVGHYDDFNFGIYGSNPD
ncbi:MAG: thrombospondin type 3 repeat-containing protein, partial [Myxococcota bacterium]